MRASFMTEAKYWQKLRKLIVKRLPYVWKIHANYQAGVPDWYASGLKQDMWIENKRVYRDAAQPPKILDLSDTDKYLSLNQQLWLGKRHDEGRNVAVIVFGRVGHVFLPGNEWKRPLPREEFIERAIDMPTLANKLVEILGQKELK
jgi:hypothetical protein